MFTSAKALHARIFYRRFSKDYPRTLTAHDIDLKDLLDAFYLLGKVPEVILYAISISALQDVGVLELSPEIAAVVPEVARRLKDESKFISVYKVALSKTLA